MTSPRPGTSPVQRGWLALLGGGEWTPGSEEVDQHLLAQAGTSQVLVLPTAAAYEHPDKAVAVAKTYFAGLGATVQGCMVLRRADAEDPATAAQVRAARFIYLAGGSVLHLRSVLKSSPVWEALVAAWAGGAVVAGSSAGAMVLGDAMVDPRGGALTLGLGLVSQLAILPHAGSWADEKTQRTVNLATGGLRIASVEEHSALLLSPEGQWSTAGAGTVTVWLDGEQHGLEALAPCSPLRD